MCQGCVDNGSLNQATFDRIESFCERYPYTAYGPAHIVLDDFNVSDGDIQGCIRYIDAILAQDENILTEWERTWVPGLFFHEHQNPDLPITRDFLNELLLIPEDER